MRRKCCRLSFNFVTSSLLRFEELPEDEDLSSLDDSDALSLWSLSSSFDVWLHSSSSIMFYLVGKYSSSSGTFSNLLGFSARPWRARLPYRRRTSWLILASSPSLSDSIASKDYFKSAIWWVKAPCLKRDYGLAFYCRSMELALSESRLISW